MSLADIEQTITQLGNLSGRQDELRQLAQAVKEQQQRLKLSVDGAVKIMAAFRGGRQAMEAILQRANAEKGQQDQYINDLIAILNNEPTAATVDQSINDLKLAAEGNSTPEQMNELIREAGLTPEEIAAIGLNNGQVPPPPPDAAAQGQDQQPPPPPPAVGGFNWRSAMRRTRSRRNSKKKIKRTRSRRGSKIRRSNSTRSKTKIRPKSN